MTRVLSFLKHNAIAIAALFIALGGTSYAAVAIPRNSVGTRQLRNDAVTPAKLSRAARTQVAALTLIGSDGTVAVSSTPGNVKTQQWMSFPNGGLGGYIVYPQKFPKTCMPMATVDGDIMAASPPAVTAVPVGGRGFSEVQITTSASTGVTVAILCPRGV